MLGVVFRVIESQYLRSLRIVHIFRIVVIFVQKLLNRLLIELFPCKVDLVKFEGAYIRKRVLQ